MTRKYLKNFMNFTREVLNYLIFSQAYSEATWGNVEVVAEYLLDITEERKMFNMTLAQLSLVILYLVFNSLYHSWAWLCQTQGLVTFKLTDSWWSTGEDDSSFRPCSSSGSRVRAREQGAPSRSPPRRGPGRHRWPSRHVRVAQLVSQNSGCTASILSHSRRSLCLVSLSFSLAIPASLSALSKKNIFSLKLHMKLWKVWSQTTRNICVLTWRLHPCPSCWPPPSSWTPPSWRLASCSETSPSGPRLKSYNRLQAALWACCGVLPGWRSRGDGDWFAAALKELVDTKDYEAVFVFLREVIWDDRRNEPW